MPRDPIDVQTMSPEEFRARLGQLHLSMSALSRRWQVGLRTVQQWVSGERGIPSTVVMLLRLEAEEVPTRARELRDQDTGEDK